MAESQTRDLAPFGVRMPPDLKKRVSDAAIENNRSMNAEIVATLEEKYPTPPILTYPEAETFLWNAIQDVAHHVSRGIQKDVALQQFRWAQAAHRRAVFAEAEN